VICYLEFVIWNLEFPFGNCSLLFHLRFMILYFEFEEKRRKADVKWPKDDEPIAVHLNDRELAKTLPTDLLYDVENRRVVFQIEDRDNKRLTELQEIIARRLQEFVQKD